MSLESGKNTSGKNASNTSGYQAAAKAISEFKPTSMFSVKEEQQSEDDQINQELMNDDDIRKITRLQLINASARFELLSANQ